MCFLYFSSSSALFDKPGILLRCNNGTFDLSFISDSGIADNLSILLYINLIIRLDVSLISCSNSNLACSSIVYIYLDNYRKSIP